MMRISLVACLGSLLVGCGDPEEAPRVDAAPLPDARTCSALPSYDSAVAARASERPTEGPTGMRRIVSFIEVPSPGFRDYVILDLYADRGVFAGGDIAPGTYTLEGAETTYSTCGACVLVATNEYPFGSNGIDYQEYYFAQSGTLTLTETRGRLTGSLSNVSLTHVVHERGELPTDEIAGDGCMTTVPDLAFDAVF